MKGNTDVFGYVIENVRFQWHVHVYRPGHPAQLALSDVEDAVYAADYIACYLSVARISREAIGGNKEHERYLHPIPCRHCELFDGRLEFRQP